MTSEHVGLKVSTLNGIHSLITDTPQSVIEHVPALVPRLLQLAKDPTSMVCYTRSQTIASNFHDNTFTEGAHWVTVLYWKPDNSTYVHSRF